MLTDIFRYGVILKRLGLTSQAMAIMVEAVNKEPLHWGAWLELSLLVHDKDTVGFCFVFSSILLTSVSFSLMHK